MHGLVKEYALAVWSVEVDVTVCEVDVIWSGDSYGGRSTGTTTKDVL